MLPRCVGIDLHLSGALNEQRSLRARLLGRRSGLAGLGADLNLAAKQRGKARRIAEDQAR